MPEGNREKIEAAIDAVNRGDRAAAQALMHPEAELISTTARVEGIVYRGDHLIEDWLAAIEEWADDYRIELGEIIGEGDEWVAEFRNVARARGSGIPIDDRRYLAVRFKDGLFWRVQTLDDEEEARAVSRLRE